jgi:predicted CXXCH cytochrome family protein
MKNTVHGAIMLLGCTSCHSPHSSAHRPLLNEAMPGLCKRCHEEEQLAKAELHRSIGDTSCLTCHDPHATDAPKLLTEGEDGAEHDKGSVTMVRP